MVNVHASGPYGIVILTFLVSGYFVPTIVAAARGRHALGVFLVNLLFGWTFVGWLIALWAAMRGGDPVTVGHAS
jgi:Superinfection immunity protein